MLRFSEYYAVNMQCYTEGKMYRQRAGRSAKKHQHKPVQAGFTLVELSLTLVIISIVVVSFFGLFVSLVHSTVVAKRRAVALTLATNHMEFLKSQPYDSLIVQSPTTMTQKINGVSYTVKTTIRYIDDAYDGCGSGYSAQFPASVYCRNYPSPSGAPNPDLNPNDYKMALVVVSDNTAAQLASVDTEIAARVSETATNTGALFVHVVDGSGAPISGVTITVTNTTVSPNVNKSDTTDQNGGVIFYGLTPDSGSDYVITASKSGYSSLSTIAATGSGNNTLQPTYPNQKILTQQSSSTTLTLYPMGSNSLLLEATDTSGSPLTGGVKVYIKGGYKKYTSTKDSSYYYDNMTPSDSRPVTDGSGFVALANLVPSSSGYIFCGDLGNDNCKVGNTTYYLAAAIPYGGNNPLYPVAVPTYDASNPPATTYPYGGTNYLQEVRLMFTTNSSFPRVFSMQPYELSLAAGGLSSTNIAITGYNISTATVKLVQGGNTYTGANCSAGTTLLNAQQLSCTFDLTGISTGSAQLMVSNGSGTLTLPVTPQGGFNVTP